MAYFGLCLLLLLQLDWLQLFFPRSYDPTINDNINNRSLFRRRRINIGLRAQRRADLLRGRVPRGGSSYLNAAVSEDGCVAVLGDF